MRWHCPLAPKFRLEWHAMRISWCIPIQSNYSQVANHFMKTRNLFAINITTDEKGSRRPKLSIAGRCDPSICLVVRSIPIYTADVLQLGDAPRLLPPSLQPHGMQCKPLLGSRYLDGKLCPGTPLPHVWTTKETRAKDIKLVIYKLSSQIKFQLHHCVCYDKIIKSRPHSTMFRLYFLEHFFIHVE